MATIHFILQGKGGVGKSNVASQLAQYLIGKGLGVFGYDTDPVNATFAGYKAFKVSVVNLLEGQTINQRQFDPFIEELFSLPDEAHAVIDNGAATFLPTCAYMAQNPVIPLLQEKGTVYLHTVITGGQALGDTLNGFEALARGFTSAPLVVWLNRFFGEIRAKDGRSFEELDEYRNHAGRVHALVRIPHLNRDTYGKDLEILLSRRQTYAEALADETWNLMARQRLTIFRRQMAEELDKARIC